MPSNGAAIDLRLVPEAAASKADEPAASPAKTGIETTIGEAVASAATGMCYALVQHLNGGLTDEARRANGERIAKLAMLRLDTIGDPNLDFAATARAEGARVLRTYFDAEFYRTHGRGAGEATIDVIIPSVLEVVERVVASELAYRAN